MYSLSEITSFLQLHKEEIREKFKVKEIGVFGSFVKGKQQSNSDIDFLVEFEQGKKTFDNLMELKFFLEDNLHNEIDLVLKSAVRRELRNRIFSETVYA
ncbi:MAG: nucleotidyltransferase family protein [Ignavibacteriales bacterium]|nr:nucleotidyltransferase family protein [Ignavibacteriales bacterium]